MGILFAIALLGIVGVISTWLHSPRPGMTLEARFQNIGRLAPMAPVLLRDKEIGCVEQIVFDPARNATLVKLRIFNEYANEIHTDSRVSIRWRDEGMEGNSRLGFHIVVEPGTPSAPRVVPGTVLAVDETDFTAASSAGASTNTQAQQLEFRLYLDRLAATNKPIKIDSVSILSTYSGWVSTQASLTLTYRNGQFEGNGHSVPASVISNLLALLREPPRAEIQPEDLGLTPDWLTANRQRLLTAFGGEDKEAIFPLASPRQRAWLTNALFDLKLLGELVRGSAFDVWSDDYPEITIRLNSQHGEVARLYSHRQVTFMLPWQVTGGTNSYTTYNAGLSRAVASLLPEGFLNRERIQGDLFSIIKDDFADLGQVQAQIRQMTLEETLGSETNRLMKEYELRDYLMPAGNYGLFPCTWMATLHRSNWPPRLLMPIHAYVESGQVRMLPHLLDTADARMRPVLQSTWVMGLLRKPGEITIAVEPTGSMADKLYLREYMAEVGLDSFYVEIKPLMEEGLAFTLRERNGIKPRTSQWIVLPNQKLLLVQFTGDGVLDWTPDQLGFRGDRKRLEGINFNCVGVFVSAAGQIEKVFPQAEP